MSKLQNYSDGERTTIYLKDETGDYSSGVILSGNSIAYVLHPITSFGKDETAAIVEANRLYREEIYDASQGMPTPDEYAKGCFIETLRDGEKAVATPVSKPPLAIVDAIAAMEAHERVGDGIQHTADTLLGRELPTKNPPQKPQQAANFEMMGMVDFGLSPTVLKEVKAYVFRLRKGARDEDIKQIRPDAGPTGHIEGKDI